MVVSSSWSPLTASLPPLDSASDATCTPSRLYWQQLSQPALSPSLPVQHRYCSILTLFSIAAHKAINFASPKKPAHVMLPNSCIVCQNDMDLSLYQQSEPNQEGDPLPTHDTPQSSHITASRLDWYATSSPGLLPSPTLQSLDYMGRTVAVSPHFGCCVILASDQSNKSGSSNQFEIGLRSIACVKPDMRLTTEVLLSSYGFSDVFQLSKSLEVLSGHLQAQVLTHTVFSSLSNYITLLCVCV